MMSLYGYQIAPIDFWEGWISEADYIKKMISKRTGSGSYLDIAKIDRMRDELWTYDQFRKDAFNVAESVNWDGDISDGPYICALPESDGGTPKLIMGFKQSNDGATYIISPERLAYLESGAFSFISQGEVFYP